MAIWPKKLKKNANKNWNSETRQYLNGPTRWLTGFIIYIIMVLKNVFTGISSQGKFLICETFVYIFYSFFVLWSNIFLTRDDRIKIGNLEFSRSIDDDDSSMISTYAGTYKYTSPEIRNGQKYSFKTDVWSLGCIVYEIITLTSLYELIELNGCDLDRLIESLNTTDTLRPLIQQYDFVLLFFPYKS